jgi:hypothetical protein
MSGSITVAPIVEGHGETEAVRILIERTWREIAGGQYAQVLRPLRRPRTELIQRPGLERALLHTANRVASVSQATSPLVLLLLDAHDDAVCVLAPRLSHIAQEVCGHLDFSCVLADREFETWFVAAAESLSQYLSDDLQTVAAVQDISGLGKAWVARHFRGTYSETVDQPRLTAAMDLVQVRARSPSFDKFCRELERRVSA